MTQISNVQAVKVIDGKEVPCAGSLYYRGYNIKDLTAGFVNDNRFGFEETTYLLLFGKLPSAKELADFQALLAAQRSLPRNFVRDVIMKAPGRDIMNALSRSVLTLYSYDNNPDDISLPNVLRQCLNLISEFPLLSVYGFLMGISSFSEEKCTHRTSIIGSILNGIFMVGWLAFFLMGV